MVSDLEKAHKEGKVFTVKTEHIDDEKLTNGSNVIGMRWKGNRYIIEIMDPKTVNLKGTF